MDFVCWYVFSVTRAVRARGVRAAAFGGLGREGGERPTEQAEAAVAAGEGWQTKGLVGEHVCLPRCHSSER